jgi:signal transduction histidine kinase
MQITPEILLIFYSATVTLIVSLTFLFLWHRLGWTRLLSFGASFFCLALLLIHNAVGMSFGWQHPFRFQFGATMVVLSLVFITAGCMAYVDFKVPWKMILGTACAILIGTEVVMATWGVASIVYLPVLIGVVDLFCSFLFWTRRRTFAGRTVATLFFARGAMHLPWPLFVFTPAGNLIRSADQVFVVAIGLSLIVAELLRARMDLAKANATLLEQATALKAANEKLGVERELAVSASNAKSAFLANMSHELRTPLNAIMGFSEIIAKSPAERMADHYTGYGEDIHQAACVLLDFVDQVLELSRLEANRVDFNPATLDIVALVDVAINAARQKAGSSPAEIIRYFEEGTGSVEGDEHLLKQALSGILIRALRFTGDKGSVHVSAGPEPESSVRIEVKDNGPRLSDSEITDAFNPFNITNATVTQTGGGIDLSLPLAKRFVEAHGGEISVSNKAEAGTIVSIDLPRRLLLH